MGGRPRKPTAKHKADGTYKPCRHGMRADVSVVSSVPEMPDDLPEDGQRLWQSVMRSLPVEVWTESDFATLTQACRWYAMAELALKSMDTKEASAATKCYLACAAKVGLSPVDRAKLHAPPPVEEDELDRLMKLRVMG